MSIGHPIPEIRLFQNLTLKIQGQGHGWGERWKSHMGPTFHRLISLSFYVNRPSHSWDTAFSWTFKIQGQDHGWSQSWGSQSGCNILSTHIPFVNWPSHSWDTFSKFDFENPRSRSKSHMGQMTMTLHHYRSRHVHETFNGVNPFSSFTDMRSAKSGPNLWQIWQVFDPWASPHGANGKRTMTVHNFRPRQFHRTSNGENPSSGYRDMGSASLTAACLDRDNNTPPAWRAEGKKHWFWPKFGNSGL